MPYCMKFATGGAGRIRNRSLFDQCFGKENRRAKMCCSVCSSDSELVGHHVVVSVDLFPAHLNVWCRLWIVSDRIFVTNLTFSSAVANVLLSYASSDARWFISCAQAECCLCAHREAHQRERRRGRLISASGVSCAHRASLISASGRRKM